MDHPTTNQILVNHYLQLKAEDFTCKYPPIFADLVEKQILNILKSHLLSEACSNTKLFIQALSILDNKINLSYRCYIIVLQDFIKSVNSVDNTPLPWEQVDTDYYLKDCQDFNLDPEKYRRFFTFRSPQETFMDQVD